VLVVGNYGTGKSHLMSVLSLVAEDAAYAADDPPPQGRRSGAPIAGKFKVHRIEISSQMSLRHIITQQLELFLEKNSASATRSRPPTRWSTTRLLRGDDGRVRRGFPNHGRAAGGRRVPRVPASRKDHDLVLDLSIPASDRRSHQAPAFRFVAGVQEAIFDSNRFQHVADSLRRVKDRFTQVLLARQDVSFVVAERLLKKTADQQNKIREYLTPFAKFYSSMNERMDEYVRLFPVHPEYIGTFERSDLHREARRTGHHARPDAGRPEGRAQPIAPVHRLRQVLGTPSPPTRCCAPTPTSRKS
jgi:hypothetical protein